MFKKGSHFVAGLMVGIFVSVVVFAVISSGNKNTEKIINLKVAHSLDSQHPIHLALEYMKERMSELSGGTVNIDIYSGGVLGNSTNCIEQLQNGTLAMAQTAASPIEGFVPEMAIFSLPYVFRNREHYWKVLDSQLGKDLLMKGQKKNFLGLCYYDAGSRNFYTKDKPVETPEDLKGLKIRVMNSKTAMDMIRALNASPTPIAFGELYTSLQQGVVDGAENNPPSFYTSRHFEVCKYLSMDGHTRIPDVLLVSSKVWKSLPADVKVWLAQAAEDSSHYQRKLWKEKTDEALLKVKEEGVFVSYPDKQPFIEKVTPLLDSYKGSEIGNLLEKIRGM
jgi:tripartite ATP-independent transporter DctP family solute receptor